MNLKNVLKTYSLLRSLSDDESALLETLRSLSDSEREQLVETLSPTKAAKKPIPRCVECGLAKESINHRHSNQADYHEFRLRKKREVKSSHAQSLSSAIQRAGKGKVEDATVSGFADDTDMIRCSDCGADSDDNVHHKRSNENYHPFVSASDADSAGERSSANGAAVSGTASSEVEKESVSTATGG